MGWEDPLEEGMATHSSILAWRVPTDKETWWATVHGHKESDMTEQLSTAQHIPKQQSSMRILVVASIILESSL